MEIYKSIIERLCSSISNMSKLATYRCYKIHGRCWPPIRFQEWPREEEPGVFSTGTSFEVAARKDFNPVTTWLWWWMMKMSVGQERVGEPAGYTAPGRWVFALRRAFCSPSFYSSSHSFFFLSLLSFFSRPLVPLSLSLSPSLPFVSISRFSAFFLFLCSPLPRLVPI